VCPWAARWKTRAAAPLQAEAPSLIAHTSSSHQCDPVKLDEAEYLVKLNEAG